MKNRNRQRQKPFITFVGERVGKKKEKQRLEREDRERQGLITTESELASKAKQKELDAEYERMNYDVCDMGEVLYDTRVGEKRPLINEHFDTFLKEEYYQMDSDGLSFEDFYVMSEQFF